MTLLKRFRDFIAKIGGYFVEIVYLCMLISIYGTTAWTAGTPTTNLAWAVSNKGQTWALTPKN